MPMLNSMICSIVWRQRKSEIPRLRAQFLRELANELGADFAIRYTAAQKKFKQQFRNRVQERMSQKDRKALGKMGRLASEKQKR